MSEYLPIQPGEFQAAEAILYFDNICDENGQKLVKAEKRRRLKEKMSELYYLHPEENKCILKDGREVPIIVCRKNPGRSGFCYFNNVFAPQDEILQAFADKIGCTLRRERPLKKQDEDMIAQAALVFFDDIKKDGKKLTSGAKLQELHHLFASLFEDEKSNRLNTPQGIVPIIVKRQGTNGRTAYCLNLKDYPYDVMRAFASWAGCRYRQEREGWVNPLERHKDEMTARECSKIFHNVPAFNKHIANKYSSMKLVEWFSKIGDDDALNRVTLPNGDIVPILVYRQSGSQTCWCLNTSDESVKPFVIQRAGEIIDATICFDNLTVKMKNPSQMYHLHKDLQRAALVAPKPSQKDFYRQYAQKVSDLLHIQTRKCAERV